MARFAKIAIAKLVKAGVEIHAVLGEAIERHIYDFDNGDVVEPDCQYQAAMNGWVNACAGEVTTTALPASPLPWRGVFGQKDAYLTDAHDRGTGICIYNANDSARQDLAAVLDAVNAQASLTVIPEVAVIMSGGVMQDVIGRNSSPVIVHLVDYDVEAGHADNSHIPQGDGSTADASVCTYLPGGISLDIVGGPAFWSSLK
jgi:hypothetical protein